MSKLKRWWLQRKARKQEALKADAMNKLRIADLSSSNDDKALIEACKALLRALREQEGLDPNDPSRIDPNDPVFIRFREARWQTEMQIQCETMKHVWTEGAHLLLDVGIGLTAFLAGYMIANLPGGIFSAIAAVVAKKVAEPALCQPRLWNKRVWAKFFDSIPKKAGGWGNDKEFIFESSNTKNNLRTLLEGKKRSQKNTKRLKRPPLWLQKFNILNKKRNNINSKAA